MGKATDVLEAKPPTSPLALVAHRSYSSRRHCRSSCRELGAATTRPGRLTHPQPTARSSRQRRAARCGCRSSWQRSALSCCKSGAVPTTTPAQQQRRAAARAPSWWSRTCRRCALRCWTSCRSCPSVVTGALVSLDGTHRAHQRPHQLLLVLYRRHSAACVPPQARICNADGRVGGQDAKVPGSPGGCTFLRRSTSKR